MSSSHFIYRRIALAAIIASVLGSPVRAETRQNLVIRGHVRDADGAPIRDAWVVCKGSRRVAAFVDAKGEYRLIIPGGTPAEMSRIPLRLRIQASHKEWALGLPGGDSELGIEMRMGVDRMGVTYINVRSNRPEVTSLLASAIGAAPDRPVDIPIDFTGVPSYLSQTPSDAPLELTSELSVDIAGYAHQLPSPSAADATARPRRNESGAMAPGPVRPSASQVAEVLAQPDNEDPLPRASEAGIAGLNASPFAGAADPAQPSSRQLASILAQPDDEDPPATHVPVFAVSLDVALPEPRRSQSGATFDVRPALPSRVDVPPLAGLLSAESGVVADDVETNLDPTFVMPTSATFPDRPAAATGPLAWAGRSTTSFDGLVFRSPAASVTGFSAPLIERRMDRPVMNEMASLPLASATTVTPLPASSPVQAPATTSSQTPSTTLVAAPPAADTSIQVQAPATTSSLTTPSTTLVAAPPAADASTPVQTPATTSSSPTPSTTLVAAQPAADTSIPVQTPAATSSPTFSPAPSTTLVATPPAVDSNAGEQRATVSSPPSIKLVSTRQPSIATGEAPATPVVSGSPVAPSSSVVPSGDRKITIAKASPAAVEAPSSVATLKPSRGSDGEQARPSGRANAEPVFIKLSTPPDVLERLSVFSAPKGQAVPSPTRPAAMYPPIEKTAPSAPVIRSVTPSAAARGTTVLIRSSDGAPITLTTPSETATLVRPSAEAPPTHETITLARSSGAAPPVAPGEISPVAATPTGVPASSSDSPAGNCKCRVDGTIEVISNRPIKERTRIAIYAEDDPENRYMLELFMGSPRPFELRAMPCGTHRLVVEVLSGARLNLITTDLSVNCAAGYRPMRIVFEPQRRMSAQDDHAGAAASEGQTSK